MNRLNLEKLEYLNFEELVYYTDCKPAKVKKLIEDGAFKTSPAKDDLFLTDSVNHYMQTGLYTNGDTEPNSMKAERKEENRLQHLKNIESAQASYEDAIEALPEKHQALDYNSDSTVASVLRRNGLINRFM